MTAAAIEADALWAAVGDPTRRRLLDTLLALGETTATRLAGELPVTRQAIAKHLQVLDRVGLVDGHKEGREVLWAVDPERLGEAGEAMARAAAAWDQRLAAIKELAEAAHAEATKK